MRIFAVDENNDLHLGANGQLAMNTGLAAVMQACEHAMQSLLGEMVFSAGRGLPYQETVWGATPNLRLFEDASRKILGAIPGVHSVTTFTCERQDNTLRYWATIQSVYGPFTTGGQGKNNG